MIYFPIFNLFNKIQNCFQENLQIPLSNNKIEPPSSLHSYSTFLTILPTECVQKIIQYLLEEKQGLYSCLLINRYWFKIVIPYLWRQPFELCSPKNRLKLFKTYLLCFDQIELESLTIRMVDALHTFNLYPKKRNPLYNYFIFLRKVSSREIEDIISPIYNELGINKKSKLNQEFRIEIPKFNKLILHHIFKYSKNLNLFDLDHWMKGDIMTINDHDHDIIKNSELPGLIGINKFKIKNIGVIIGGKSELFQFISTYYYHGFN
ncbi:hypothetical protein GLOIN_2v1541899 [Rhizophagus clarus]|uniref:F-box domain-containing protein n=1 Tax=Rhizophagus clarus TaxID=94130 RepID=A0A8H3R149_9GLOM|nr:hypothetical protein GLOIN_2v1541899 [Rhizophagus clarus]